MSAGQIKIDENLKKLSVNTIRFLAVDGVQKANSGHPGMPMGMADVAFILWTQFLKYNPDDPDWINRDRFILSGGHGSMLIYAMLHLAGYDVSNEDLQQFRQWGSKTPGHPEHNVIPGIETTTGPLGQGVANGVGMALAQKILAAKFNDKESAIFDHHVYAICGDGDMMEGVTSEAVSLAGHLKLGNLVLIYDDNNITIEGNTELAFSEDVAKRFEAYGWHVVKTNAHNHDEITSALQAGVDEADKPTLVIATSHIGFGSPNLQDTSTVHGSPLGDEEVAATKKNLGWPVEPKFYVPDEVKDVFAQRKDALKPEYDAWQTLYATWEKENPEKAELWKTMMDKTIPEDLEEQLIAALPDKATATRALGGVVLNKAAELVPSLHGGAADLEPSTKTYIKEAGSIGRDNFEGRNLHFGVREHGMGSIMNGMALYNGLIMYGATFMVFADYMRPPIRIAAMQKSQAIYVFTHDSIFVGEDGPTHQPIETVSSLRCMPNVHVCRPADGMETAMAWAYALRRKDGPTALALTRQGVPVLEREAGFDPKTIQKGGYILDKEENDALDLILVGTGSEVSVALEAKKLLAEKSYTTRVVSIPCLEAFNAQSDEYKSEVIPENVPVVIVEAGVAQGWHSITRAPLLFIGMDRFGASGPYQVLAEKFGFTGPSVAEMSECWIKGL